MNKLDKLQADFLTWKGREPKVDRFEDGKISVELDLFRGEVVISRCKCGLAGQYEYVLSVKFDDFKRIFDYLSQFF